MTATRSLCAATLLATSVTFAVGTHAADTTTAPPHHHHHHHAETAATAKSATAKPVAAKAAHGAHAHHAAHEGGSKAKHPATPESAHKSAAHHHPAKHPLTHHHAAPAAGAVVPAPKSIPDGAPTPQQPDASAPGAPAAAPDAQKGTNTGLPLPRFAAFRADEVNMRAGPGQRYPIQWVYHRRGLPVVIEREFDVWRLVEDSDGVKGWVHQATLVGSRDFVVPGASPETPAATPGAAQPQQGQMSAQSSTGHADQSPAGHMESRVIGSVATEADALKTSGGVMLRASGDDSAPVVAVLKPGVVGTLRTCAAGSAWCKVSVRQYDGWLRRSSVWGVSADEAYPPS
ncbi:SH3 domain-containing protein [Acetobacter nitrogenifigens]|uniref:SH3b domain-containing protein n=1 Tax=Acetobacter nitrogenifigens DSM 23921 = NBRC 105050 TaxID=1120919 RepID=A0A511X7K9_9PROT|nr:SH3 domain-containing protein [Acetobacter nitrogenifigens]GEN58905.1 hypothetical protein ANI02nite_07890 [Acetobacter nitrogenifigens DSM 23921 = NBRC 105050]